MGRIKRIFFTNDKDAARNANVDNPMEVNSAIDGFIMSL